MTWPMLVDAHHVGLQETGNETWARNVLLALEDRFDRDDFVHVLTRPGRESLKGLVPGERTRLVSGSSSRRLLLDLPRVVRELRPRALLVHYTRPPMVRTPTAVVVHDVSFHEPLASRWIPRASLLRYRVTVDASVRAARVVLTPSEHARQAVLAHYGLAPERVLLAANAVAPEFLAAVARARSLRPPDHRRVLMVGTVLPRKNLPVVSAAVAALRGAGQDVRLRLVGPVRTAGHADLAQARELLGPALDVVGAVTLAQLAEEYASAHVLAFPSLYEGFGIPLLEAMAAGTPVVCSTSSCLPEVAGGAALLVAPTDVPGWAVALQEAWERPEELVTRGSARVQDFSWHSTANRVVEALKLAAA